MTSWYFESTLLSRSSMGGSMMPWLCPAMGEPPGSQTDVVEDGRRAEAPKQTVYRVSATTSSAARHPLIRESSIGGRVGAPPAPTRTRMLDSHTNARLARPMRCGCRGDQDVLAEVLPPAVGLADAASTLTMSAS